MSGRAEGIRPACDPFSDARIFQTQVPVCHRRKCGQLCAFSRRHVDRGEILDADEWYYSVHLVILQWWSLDWIASTHGLSTYTRGSMAELSAIISSYAKGLPTIETNTINKTNMKQIQATQRKHKTKK